MRTIRWGILGAGVIAGKFSIGLASLDYAEIAAVASRSLGKAHIFAKKYGVKKAYGNYAELVNDRNIDVIYIAVPHSAHEECSMLALNAGKPVLCEKPFTINAAELEKLVTKARESKLFLMEAMWTRYLPATIKVMEWLKSGVLGDIRMLKADFGFRSNWDPKNRLFNINLGGGALLDAGIYPVSFASMVFGSKPNDIKSVSYIGKTGVDEQFMMLLSYDRGRMASLGGAVRTNMDNDAWIFGSKGRIYIPRFLSARLATLFIDGRDTEVYESEFAANGYNYEAAEVMRCLRECKLESDTMPLNESLEIMKILDNVRTQWGLKYPFE
jgi:dihydrodiol dehydrogenase / D-xylose 1-dehydrogenase (NADP)